MRKFRFTIGSLLGLVVFAAVAFAALREATALWDSAVFTLVSAFLLASVLLAVHRGGEFRAFWLGFALFGAVYLVASVIPHVESRMATSRGLAFLDSRIPGRERQPVYRVMRSRSAPGSRQNFAVASLSRGNVRLWDVSTGKLLSGPNGTSEDFLRIGHSFVALLAAFAGGWLSRWLHASGQRRDEAAAHLESPLPGREP